MPKGEEIVALCEKHHWKVIVGIEPDHPEDLSDIDLLLRGPAGEPRLLARRPGSAAMIIALAGVARSSRTAVQPLERMEAQSLDHPNRGT